MYYQKPPTSISLKDLEDLDDREETKEESEHISLVE